MPNNLIRRTIQVQQSPATRSRDVFFVMWTRDGREYFLVDADLNFHNIQWTSSLSNAIPFDNGDEALDIINTIKATRTGHKGRIELMFTGETPESDDMFDHWTI